MLPRLGVCVAIAGMRVRGWILWVIFSSVALASSWKIPADEARELPSTTRLAEIPAAASAEGWSSVEAGAMEAAFAAMAENRTDAAEAWLLVGRWARLFGASQRTVVNRWIEAMNAANAAHPNMAKEYLPPDGAMSSLVNPDLGAWLFANREFSRSFFEALSPLDYPPAVIGILDTLHRADSRRFERHALLALAIAIVYDVPPPPHWPHGQVDAARLPRRLPPAVEAFSYWAAADDRNQLLHRLSRLSVTELKFVVDSPAPFPEMDWARQSVRLPLTRLAETYDAVKYRHDRVQGNVVAWPGGRYTLPAILEDGGICVDQAYFAAQVGKARGVPTLVFRGVGLDGRHAWFGYLGPGERWQMDAGRHAEQRYVLGVAFDPQTWRDISDHEISFLAEGFRRLPSYRQSRLHLWFAQEFRRGARLDEAGAAARKAVNFERRNLRAWDLLLELQAAQGNDPRGREALLREAALAFQRYPDLNVSFLRRVAEALREQGNVSAAEQEERLIARKYQGERADLSVGQAAEALTRAMQSQSIAEQLRVYQFGLDQYGRGARMEYFDRVVKPFVEHLVRQGHAAEARQAIARARESLAIEPGRQLDRELAMLASSIQ